MLCYYKLLEKIKVTKRSIVTIAMLSILAAFFDAPGLALIYYGVSAFTQTEPSQSLFVNFQIELLNLSMILASLTAIYIVRYCVLTYHAYRKSQFIFDVETRSGQEVITQYLSQNLLRKKANEHINYLNAITKESIQLQAYSISVINLIAEVCQALIIFLFFIFYSSTLSNSCSSYWRTRVNRYKFLRKNIERYCATALSNRKITIKNRSRNNNPI